MYTATKIYNPELCITMLANPKWEEIINNLKICETWYNRLNIIDRIFWLKLDNLFVINAY